MIQFGQGVVQVTRDWPTFKKILDGTQKSLVLQEEDLDHQHQLFAVDQGVVYSTTLYDAGYEPVGWSQQQKDDNASWLVDYEANWEPSANKSLTTAVPILQERETNGHYNMVGVDFSIPPSSVRYHDLTVPDLENGWDWLNFHFYAGDSTTGDRIVSGKALVGRVGALAAGAGVGDTTIVVMAPTGILMPTKQGGKIDVGYYVSLGTEASTAAALNAVTPAPPGMGTLANPEGELREYRIKTIGPQTLVDPAVATAMGLTGSYSTVPLGLFESLVAAHVAGTPTNLVVRVFPDPLPVRRGDTLNIGASAVLAGNLPVGTVVRFGYENTSPTDTFRAIGQFEVLY